MCVVLKCATEDFLLDIFTYVIIQFLILHLGGWEGSPVDRQNAVDIIQKLCPKCRSSGSATETSVGPCCWSSVPKQAGNLITY